MQVAQPTGALLDVRFEAVGRFVVLRVALALLQHLRAEIGLSVEHFEHGLDKALEHRSGTCDQAALEHRCEGCDVALGLGATLVDRAHAVAERKAEVPQQADKTFDRGALRVVGLAGEQDQDIDVGVREELPATVPADRDDRCMLREAGRTRQVAQQAIDRSGVALQQDFDRATASKTVDQRITFQSQAIPQLESDIVHSVTRWRPRDSACRASSPTRTAAVPAWQRSG